MIRRLARYAGAGFMVGAGVAIAAIVVDALTDRTPDVMRSLGTAFSDVVRVAVVERPTRADYDAVHQSAREITRTPLDGLLGAVVAVGEKVADDAFAFVDRLADELDENGRRR